MNILNALTKVITSSAVPKNINQIRRQLKEYFIETDVEINQKKVTVSFSQNLNVKSKHENQRGKQAGYNGGVLFVVDDCVVTLAELFADNEWHEIKTKRDERAYLTEDQKKVIEELKNFKPDEFISYSNNYANSSDFNHESFNIIHKLPKPRVRVKGTNIFINL